MKHAVDLVAAIKSHKPDCCVAVAGYPEGHSEAVSLEADLDHLKEKIDAGADFIITQICFEYNKMADFIKSVREKGIQVPVIPGVFIPTSFKSLMRMCEICKITCPAEKLIEYTARKDDDAKFNKYAISEAAKFLDSLFQNGPDKVYGVHFFTLNKYGNVLEVLKRYNFNN